MRRLHSSKRCTLALCLFHTSRARSIDDLAEMLIKRMRKIEQKSKIELEEFRKQNQRRMDQLIAKLGDVAVASKLKGRPKKTLNRMREALGSPDKVIEECDRLAAVAGNNYFVFCCSHMKAHRQSLFEILRLVNLKSTSKDQKLMRALEFLLAHANSREDWLPIYELNDKKVTLLVDLSFIPAKWKKWVTGLKSRHESALKVNRKHFEACLFILLAEELQTGDIAITGSDRYSDYRNELVGELEFNQKLDNYAKTVGLPVNRPKLFVTELQANLKKKILEVDANFKKTSSLRIEKGKPILSKPPKKSEKIQLSQIEELIRSRLDPVTILDILTDTEEWIHWSRFFKPISGQKSRLRDSRERYIATVFCYACGLGPSQTARSLKTRIDKSHIAWAHHHHIQEQTLEKIITAVIQAYQQFELPKHWGSGKHVSADGTKWEVGSKNLLSEYHIRYGGYGGIGYYHVSDNYIALFSRFIPCSVWEAVYILDGLFSNETDIKPKKVHVDTQAQNTPIFGLSYLLGIQLMPRIRNWKGLKLYKPSRSLAIQNLSTLFTDDLIDWNMIEDHLPDMVRVAISIQIGKIVPSTILRKLGTRSRKNRLYFAFRELGKVFRTLFLLDFISDVELRATIQSCTNKSEAFNGFAQWLDFGDSGLRYENDRDQQRKLIKYNHLLANLVILHTVQTITKVINDLSEEGINIDLKTLSLMSPYLTGHINRFGDYRIDPERKPDSLRHRLKLKPISDTIRD